MQKGIFLHRSGKYYFRLWIPLDLRPLFTPFLGSRPDVAYSLKTTALNQASTLALKASLEANTAFTLLRTGLLTGDQVQTVIGNILPKSKTKPKPASQAESLTTESKPAATKKGGKKLTTLWELYRTENRQKWTPKSLIEFTAQFQTIIFVMGDKNAGEVDREACVKLRDTLLHQIPPNYKKKKEYRDLSLAELVKAAPGGLHPQTVNKHLSLISSVLRWAVRHGHATVNPAEGLTLEKTTRPDEERLPYSPDDLQRIINNLHTAPPPAWIPIVAMFTGARREEICSLTAKDFIEVDGIWCVDINESGEKHVKTQASIRTVPIHPRLIELGLMEYMKYQPAKGNIWGLEVWRGSAGKKYGNLYNAWNRERITDDQKKVFHSFRHNVGNALKQASIAEIVIGEILGHANSNISTGRYGKKFNPARLLEAINCLQYDLDFTQALPLLMPEA